VAAYDVTVGYEMPRMFARRLAPTRRQRRDPDLDPSDGTRVSVEAHTRCRAGTEVALYTLTGGGHTWPGEDFQWLRFRRPGNISRDFDANQTILDF